jgi:DNA (cytosine-5)-methyltransferase 1
VSIEKYRKTGGNNVPLAMTQPDTYAIAGNIINRKDKNGGNGSGIQPDISYTLNTIDRHAVYLQQNNEVEDCYTYQTTVGTLCSGDEKGAGNQYICQDKCVIGRFHCVRRLTPLECERLMGFPDGWTALKDATDSARYRALGNSVAIPCVDFALRGIAYFLRKSFERESEK